MWYSEAGGNRDEQDHNLASAWKVHNPVGEVRPRNRSNNEHLFTFTRILWPIKLQKHCCLPSQRLSEVGRAGTLIPIVK